MEREALKLALEKIATVNAMDYEYQAWAREALAQPAQEPVADRLERLLWEYIDLQAAHPEHKPNPKTWPHLMTYAPPTTASAGACGAASAGIL